MKVPIAFDRNLAITFLEAIEDGKPLSPLRDWTEEELLTLVGCVRYRLLLLLPLGGPSGTVEIDGEGNLIDQSPSGDSAEFHEEQAEKMLDRIIDACCSLTGQTIEDLPRRKFDSKFKGIAEMVGGEFRLRSDE